jgi:hypothetical protein
VLSEYTVGKIISVESYPFPNLWYLWINDLTDKEVFAEIIKNLVMGRQCWMFQVRSMHSLTRLFIRATGGRRGSMWTATTEGKRKRILLWKLHREHSLLTPWFQDFWLSKPTTSDLCLQSSYLGGWDQEDHGSRPAQAETVWGLPPQQRKKKKARTGDACLTSQLQREA